MKDICIANENLIKQKDIFDLAKCQKDGNYWESL